MPRLRLLLFPLLLAAAPAAAQPDWRAGREYEVLLSNLDIQPETIRLKAGEPVRLRLINNSTIPHSFTAKDFFRKGDVRPRERDLVANGSVEVAPGDTREILLVPAAGRYSARCRNLYHWIIGMRASIIVE